MAVAQVLVWLAFAYGFTGFCFACWYLLRAVSGVDQSARGVSWQTKALWLPGVVALWPWLLALRKKPASLGGPNPAPARHRAIWLAFAAVLPVLFVWAVFAIPQDVKSTPLPDEAGADLSQLVGQKTLGSLIFSLRKNAEKRQLKIEVTQPLEAPAVVVMVNGRALGTISTTGIYRFEITDSQPLQVELFDPIRKQILAQTTLVNN